MGSTRYQKHLSKQREIGAVVVRCSGLGGDSSEDGDSRSRSNASTGRRYNKHI